MTESSTRTHLAARHLAGAGIEIGALHNPLPLPDGVVVKYVDRLDNDTLRAHYPELADQDLVDIDIIDNGETLGTIDDATQDFVVANHFLEHCEDPIGALVNLVRVLKPGGVLYAAVPDMRRSFDHNRTATTLAHLVRDHQEGTATSRWDHFVEWVRDVEPEFGRNFDTADNIQARARELETLDYSIHFHAWTPIEVQELLDHVVSERLPDTRIEAFHELEDEILFILQTQPAGFTKRVLRRLSRDRY